LDCRDIEFALPSFFNEQRAVGKNGDGVVNSNIFYSHFALDIFNAKQFFRQKIIEI
jgi:hypothetical protein